MALSLQTKWTLVASGLVAHADHVLTGEECERLMAMVDAEVDGEEYAQWMAAIGDEASLRRMLDDLEVPPAETHRQILEDAWLMAVVDGERAEEEIETFEEIAGLLGVQMLQLEHWREAWTQAQHGYATNVTTALSWVLGGGEALEGADGAIAEFVGALPTTHEHRSELEQAASQAATLDEATRRVLGLSAALRRDGLQRLREAARSSGPESIERWRQLASATGLSDDEIERHLRD